MNKSLFLLCLFFFPVYSNEYEFKGKHFLASYMECDSDRLSANRSLHFAMDVAVLSTGATILSDNYHEFDGGGMTIVYLLSESHASIHTYPETNSCFVDIFTCGDTCSWQDFDSILQWYLHPNKVEALLLQRGEEIEELVFDGDED